MSRSISSRLFFTALVCGLLAAPTTALAQEKSLTWGWPSAPCGEMLNCNGGCSACNLPREQDATFFGTGASWLGVSACPHPKVVGDNVVFSEGWEVAPVSNKSVMLSGIALASMHLDSIIINHRSAADGPQWLRVSLKLELAGTSAVVHEGPITGEFDALSLRDLGCAVVTEGMAMGGFQVVLQAFGGNGGAWELDEVRVVAAPCVQDITTGVQDLNMDRSRTRSPRFDLLGRPAPNDAAPGFYIDAQRRVIVR